MATTQVRFVSLSKLEFLANVTSTVTARRVKKCSGASFSPEIETVTYAGDGTEEQKFILKRMNMEVKSPDFDEVGINLILGKSQVTTSLPVGVAARTYYGDETEGAGTVCGARLTVNAEDVVSAASKQYRIEMPRGTLSAVSPPPLKNIGPEELTLQFSAARTTTDIAGAALPTVPSNGAIWFLDTLS